MDLFKIQWRTSFEWNLKDTHVTFHVNSVSSNQDILVQKIKIREIQLKIRIFNDCDS